MRYKQTEACQADDSDVAANETGAMVADVGELGSQVTWYLTFII